MSKRFTVVTVALIATVAFLVGLIIAGEFTPAPIVSTAPRVTLRGMDVARPASLSSGASVVNFADVAERMNAAVVNIDSTSKGPEPGGTPRYFRRGDGAPEPPAGPRDPETPRQGAGSGFLIDRDGHILTNHHVIDGAERITVTLADGRAFRAEVVGSDPAIDVALLRIPGAHDLPSAPLGNSDELRVGEWVCAIGNPLGY
ncbi:MAG: trypsin-like peptidase domain-containing protein, partial [Acidobacteriota bacterium]